MEEITDCRKYVIWIWESGIQTETNYWSLKLIILLGYRHWRRIIIYYILESGNNNRNVWRILSSVIDIMAWDQNF